MHHPLRFSEGDDVIVVGVIAGNRWPLLSGFVPADK